MRREIEYGMFGKVRDPILSCALASIGVALREDIPPMHEVSQTPEGQDYETWSFQHRMDNSKSASSRLGSLDLKELTDLYYSPTFPQWRKENEGHPLAVAMDMYDNLMIYQAKMAASKPMVGFWERAAKQTIRWVVWGSENHRKCIERALKRFVKN